LAALCRYEMTKLGFGISKYPSLEARAAAVGTMPAIVDTIERKVLADLVSVSRPDGTSLYRRR
jgi:hypothetical protein